ncbi:MAG TPA: hypothetical protein VF003_05745, partial [Pseudonocardiaceae bacterium]
SCGHVVTQRGIFPQRGGHLADGLLLLRPDLFLSHLWRLQFLDGHGDAVQRSADIIQGIDQGGALGAMLLLVNTSRMASAICGSFCWLPNIACPPCRWGCDERAT